MTPVPPRPPTPSLAEFLDLVERRIGVPSLDRLQDVIRLFAMRIPPEARLELVELVPEATTATDPEIPRPAMAELPPVLSEVYELYEQAERLAGRLEEGRYFSHVGWDEDRREERSFGDESWAKEMDELFGRVGTSYLAGNVELAARVYGRLLGTFRHKDRVGVFCGPEVPERMITTDVNDAKRRYLRALMELTPPFERPQRLLSELEAMRGVGDRELGLRDLLTIDGDAPMEGLEAFLPAWIGALKAMARDARGFRREARRLLREAVDLSAGVDGIGRLAREEGDDHPEAYHEWVGALVRLGRVNEAVRAAREGVGRIKDAAYRARLADRLASLAVATDDTSLAVEATRAAWRASPNEIRLLRLAAAAERADVLRSVLTLEAGTVLRPDWPHSDALACRVLLLAGRHEEALTRFQRADALGWGRPDHAGSVVLPFVLLAATGHAIPPRGSALESLWSELDTPNRAYFDRRLLMDQLADMDSEEPTERQDASAALDNGRPYSDLLQESIENAPIPDAYRRRMLEVARQRVEEVVREILTGQHRRGHAVAAKLVVAVGEALALSASVDEGRTFVRAMRREYTRFATFKDELDHIRTASAILPDLGPRPDRPPLFVIK